eukprot:gnl/TRDRNA2_/TRDRNA2_174242_c0_seq2.p1 gnl/TRDRNA2_/TRDRNA2_174242_c0~~gnl/TRDRNA2_/TRDRNA2_174242_c0_seq2.p1  ORF type:complete len:141 (-),score=7.23 gnl/TRDRNA2_/TRDRNA2_174242_c0_seq2:16-438(-)
MKKQHKSSPKAASPVEAETKVCCTRKCNISGQSSAHNTRATQIKQMWHLGTSAIAHECVCRFDSRAGCGSASRRNGDQLDWIDTGGQSGALQSTTYLFVGALQRAPKTSSVHEKATHTKLHQVMRLPPRQETKCAHSIAA